MFIRPSVAMVWLLCAAGAAGAADVLVSPMQGGPIMVRINGETVMLKRIPGGAVGKIGNDKVVMITDGRGTSVVKVGATKLICRDDARSGVLICK